MLNPVKSIIRHSQRKNSDTLNILTAVSHERYEPTLALLPHTFYSVIKAGDTRTWNTKYAPVPENYHIYKHNELPPYIDIDIMISHNPFVHIPLLNEIRGNANIPLINVFHTMPVPGWGPEAYKYHKPLFDLCDWHISITDFNEMAWCLEGNNKSVIYHGMDTKQFDLGTNKQPLVLTVANDFINRDWALGYSLWKEIVSHNIPYKVVGNTPGLSRPAESITEVVQHHQSSLIYLNTAIQSPIPMSVLEAMSCGSCVVSVNSCALPDIIEHGKNGFLLAPQNVDGFVQLIKHLLAHPEEAIQIGQEARKTIQEKFSIERFLEEWNNNIYYVLGHYF